MNFATIVNKINEMGGAFKERISSPEKIVMTLTKVMRKPMPFVAGMALGGLIEAGPNSTMLGILILAPIIVLLSKAVERSFES